MMVEIRCWNCGGTWNHHDWLTDTIEACPHCGAKSHIVCRDLYNYEVKPVKSFVSNVELEEEIKDWKEIWKYLNNIEKERIIEAVKCKLVEAYTACESMCYDALVSLLRRIYGERKELGYYVGKMEKDPDLKSVGKAISYFATKRHEVDHPERVSTQDEAESTYKMTRRLIKEIIEKKIAKT